MSRFGIPQLNKGFFFFFERTKFMQHMNRNVIYDDYFFITSENVDAGFPHKPQDIESC